MHKLTFETAGRYSEDLDLVQVNAGTRDAIMDALPRVLQPWLRKPTWRQKEDRLTYIFRFKSEIEPVVPLRLKVEINMSENFIVHGPRRRTFEVDSPWHTASAEVLTYSPEELLATKLRALYQRRKGRDLFDLGAALLEPRELLIYSMIWADNDPLRVRPVEVLAMWNDAYELAERVCGTELEKWQVLEPSLAEFLGTHLPPGGAGAHETDDEKELPNKVRDAVLDRDMWQCKFPGCTMRKMLDVHHIEFRSHLGSEDHGNKISICRIHHGLVHRGICKVTGTVGVDLKFERPQLITEQKPAEAELVIQYQNEPPEEASPEEARDEEVALPDDDNDDTDERSRDEIIADVFADLLNGPRPPKSETPFEDYGAFNADWPQRPLRIVQRRVRELKDRAEQRRAGQARPGAHVCAGDKQAASTDPEPIGGGPSG